MEEQKTKSPKMGVIKNKKESSSSEPTQKLSYEQLNEACSQLYQQNQKLIQQVQQMNLTNMFKRMDYLFLVLKYEAVIKDPEFVGSCVEEIKASLTPTDSAEEEG